MLCPAWAQPFFVFLREPRCFTPANYTSQSAPSMRRFPLRAVSLCASDLYLFNWWTGSWTQHPEMIWYSALGSKIWLTLVDWCIGEDVDLSLRCSREFLSIFLGGLLFQVRLFHGDWIYWDKGGWVQWDDDSDEDFWDNFQQDFRLKTWWE